jgi:hypothetical protein
MTYLVVSPATRVCFADNLCEDDMIYLETKGYQKSVLWLSPLGGLTAKSDDVP